MRIGRIEILQAKSRVVIRLYTRVSVSGQHWYYDFVLDVGSELKAHVYLEHYERLLTEAFAEAKEEGYAAGRIHGQNEGRTQAARATRERERAYRKALRQRRKKGKRQ